VPAARAPRLPQVPRPGARAGRIELYDRIGLSYTATRREDPRLAAAIHAALGDARTVVNVGAGAGSYEPRDREVVAVEPSEAMIAQRPPGAAPVVRATAYPLPFADDSFDAAMAVLSDHHWEDRRAGLQALRRVASRAVVLAFDPAYTDRFWLVTEYLSGFSELPGMTIDDLVAALGGADVVPVPVPADCTDGFMGAFWRRPEAYLDARVRAGISVFAQLDAAQVDACVQALRADLASGAWDERHADLLELDELDLGYRLLVAPRASAAA
jgi:SAM-dependent methyltransferase